MKLLTRHASFDCLGKTFYFDVTVIIDNEERTSRFKFHNQTPDIPRREVVVFSNMDGQVMPFEVSIPNTQLADALRQCIEEYVQKFSYVS